MFASDAVLAMTGTDIATNFRGKYSAAEGAFGILGQDDVGDFAARELAAQGFKEIGKMFAQRGDLALINNGGNEALGIVSLDGTEVWAAGEFKLERVPYSEILRAWRI